MSDGKPGHFLIVPPVGLLEVVHADHGIDERRTLYDRADGVFLRLHHENLHAAWLGHEAGHLNPRARWAWNQLTGIEVVFTGPVIFAGIEENRMGEIVAQLSMRTSR